MSEISTLLPEAPPQVEARAPRKSGFVVLLGALWIVLISAVGMQLLPHSETAVVSRTAPLDIYFPLQMTGWKSEDRPLGETENLEEMVKSTLNYDEAIVRTYRKGGREFTVYVAYWKAGKMSSREVAYHTPDICWPAAGWNRIGSEENFAVPGFKFAPAQYREFVLNDHHEQVLFWHTYNGRTIAYDPIGRPSRFSMLTDLMSRGFRQKGEQYFIRITSPADFSQLWGDEGFGEIIDLIGPLGPGLSTKLEGFESASLVK